SIGDFAFGDCTGLTSIEIPNSVTSIGKSAFYYCSGLKNVYYSGTQNDWNKISIQSGNYYLTNANLICNYKSNPNTPPCETHNWDNGLITQPNCVNNGIKTYTCTVCGATFTEEAPAVGEHIYDNGIISTQPTCAEAGVKTFTCTVCGATKTESVAVTGIHTYDSGVITTQPTCTEAGVKTFTCIVCGVNKTESVKTLGHNYESVVTAPACTEQGYTTHTCSRCGDSYIDEYTDELGHNYESVVTAPTCTEQGYTTHTCSRCGDNYIDDYTDELGHNYESIVTAPTCTEQGYTTHTCTRCGDSYKDSFVTELGHNWTSWSIANAPYGCQDGLSIRICNTCNQIEYLTIPAIGDHNYIATKTVEATCQQRGFTYYQCVCCGDGFKADFTERADHTVVIDEAIPATCTRTGRTEGAHCSTCGAIITECELVEMLNHNYETEIFEATPNAQGYTKYTCSLCGWAYVSDITPYTSDASALETAIAEAHYYSNSKFSAGQIQYIIDEAESHRELSETNAPQAEYDYAVGEILTAIYSVDELAAYTTVEMNDDSVLLQNENGDEATVSFKESINEYTAPLDVVKDGIVNAKDFAYLLKNF
ncbi:MAG: leucine-rich repeat protein, partial [Eubacterium sp.]|nr:leucine-rich repeat protein [Eubacterium sp.]